VEKMSDYLHEKGFHDFDVCGPQPPRAISRATQDFEEELVRRIRGLDICPVPQGSGVPGDGDFLPDTPGPDERLMIGRGAGGDDWTEQRLVGHNPKHAAGSAKSPLHLVPMSIILEMAEVFRLSAPEYGPFNWRTAEVVRSIYLDATMRHLIAMMAGQDIDPKSKQPHRAHIAANMAILADAEHLDKLIDDRGPPGPEPELITRLTRATQGGAR
jgi:hypothetical protein